MGIIEYIAFSYYTQGNLAKALQYTNELIAVEPDHPRAEGNKFYYETHLNDNTKTDHKKGDDGTDEAEAIEPEYSVLERNLIDNAENEQSIYKRLCRGEIVKPNLDAKKLKCRLSHGFHPFMILAPLKEEELFLSPKIVIYYDVLSADETATVKALSSPRFRRATVQNYKTGELETANYRISKTAWLRREEDFRIEQIYQRVGDTTGLNMETSEELQVANYGMGGHYEPHLDFAWTARKEDTQEPFPELGMGNRIATWLFYLSDVDLGGATVFPSLNVTLWPKKGTAAFWYNLHRNGEGDVLTRHAACPVLAGTKWVSNFWIHEFDQEFRRPCSLSPF